ncbi:MAG: GDP-mannose 4,6-dehydratase, partial [Pirellulaceae bacterium]|nr:GDP-mannose 4,6-dehydratase [Pirellulaceae bacterium]
LENLSAILDHPQLTFVEGTVEEAGLVEQLVAGQDQVYHLAAAVGVALIARQPIETIQRNIHPTQLILAELQKRHQAGEKVRTF